MNKLNDTFTLKEIVKVCLREIERIEEHYKFYRSKDAIEMHGKEYCKGADEALQMAITDHVHHILLKLFNAKYFDHLYAEIEKFREEHNNDSGNGKVRKGINTEKTAQKIQRAIEMITSHGDYTDYFDEKYKKGIGTLEEVIDELKG